MAMNAAYRRRHSHPDTTTGASTVGNLLVSVSSETHDPVTGITATSVHTTIPKSDDAGRLTLELVPHSSSLLDVIIDLGQSIGHAQPLHLKSLVETIQNDNVSKQSPLKHHRLSGPHPGNKGHTVQPSKKLAPSPRLLFRWFNRTTRRHQLSVSLSKVHNQVHPMLVLDNKSSNTFQSGNSVLGLSRLQLCPEICRGWNWRIHNYQSAISRCSCTTHSATWVENDNVAAGSTTAIPQTIISAQSCASRAPCSLPGAALPKQLSHLGP